YQLSVPKKLAVMFGGPFVNLVLSGILFAIVVSGIGFTVYTNTVASVTPCVQAAADAACAADAEAAPSVEAGFEPGDVIVSWGGTPVEDWAGVSAAILAGGTEPTEVVVERGGSQTTLTVTPTLIE